MTTHRYKIDWRPSVSHVNPYAIYRQERGWFGYRRWDQIDIFPTLDEARTTLSRIISEKLPIYAEVT